jgi:hypothetical protein
MLYNVIMKELKTKDQDKRRGGGVKLLRSEIVTVRLDPKLRYLAELAARKQRRTLSSYIEWVIEKSLDGVFLNSSSDFSLHDEAEGLWDVDDADKFVKLALRHPELLTHEEQVRWKLIRENGYLWRGKYAGVDSEWTWTPTEQSIVYERLRKHWEIFCKVALQEAEKTELPTWPVTKKEVDGEDEVPF